MLLLITKTSEKKRFIWLKSPKNHFRKKSKKEKQKQKEKIESKPGGGRAVF
ncbi:hypothetical protein FPK15_contig00096-0003 [Flavobacterium psychrophilum]|nr:hypothetical protein FPK15_contig00096-0003 [Flavobacterium psychrophilum]